MPTLAGNWAVDQAALGGGTTTTPSFTPQTGDILVVKTITADSSLSTTGTPTGGGWTYTSRISDLTASHVGAKQWTAPVTAGGTAQTVALTFSGSDGRGKLIVELWRGAQLAASPVTVDTRGTGAPSTTLTPAKAGSVISWTNGDWAAVDGASRAYNTTSATPVETGYSFVTGAFTSYSAYQTAAAASAQTLGLTAPTGQTWTLIGIEIQDATAVTPGGGAAQARPGRAWLRRFHHRQIPQQAPAAGGAVVSGDVALALTSAVTADTTATLLAAAAVSGTATFTAAATAAELAAATVAATATVTAAGTATVLGAAAVSVAAAITATASVTAGGISASAAVAETATITATATAAELAAAAVAATATITATGTATGLAAAAVAATATITATAAVTALAAAAVSGTATITAAGTGTRLAAASVATTAAITATATVGTAPISADVALSATAAVTAAGTKTGLASAAVTTTAAITTAGALSPAAAAAAVTAAAAITAAGTVTARGAAAVATTAAITATFTVPLPFTIGALTAATAAQAALTTASASNTLTAATAARAALTAQDQKAGGPS